MKEIPFDKMFKDIVGNKIEEVAAAFLNLQVNRDYAYSMDDFFEKAKSINNIINTKNDMFFDYYATGNKEMVIKNQEICLQKVSELKEIYISDRFRNLMKEDVLYRKSMFLLYRSFIYKETFEYPKAELSALKAIDKAIEMLPKRIKIAEKHKDTISKLDKKNSIEIYNRINSGLYNLRYFSMLLNLIDDKDFSWMHNQIGEIDNGDKKISNKKTKISNKKTKISNKKRKAVEIEFRPASADSQAQTVANLITNFAINLKNNMSKTAFDSIDEIPNFEAMFDYKAYIMEEDEKDARIHTEILKQNYKDIKKIWQNNDDRTKLEVCKLLRAKQQKVEILLPELYEKAENFVRIAKRNSRAYVDSEGLISRVVDSDALFGFTELIMQNLYKKDPPSVKKISRIAKAIEIPFIKSRE